MSVAQIGRDIETLAKSWARRAAGSQPPLPGVPHHVFVGEALELALFLEHYWEPRAELGLPGLAALASPTLDERTAAELRELALAVMYWEGKYNATYVPPRRAPVERARVVLQELLAALSFVCDAEPKSKRAAQLASVRASLTTGTYDGFALGLESVARLARDLERKLTPLAGFDATLIDEAVTLAGALRQQSAKKLTSGELRATRMRGSRLLHERITAARSVVKFAFRRHPELVARATGTYRRERRSSQRAAKRAAK